MFHREIWQTSSPAIILYAMQGANERKSGIGVPHDNRISAADNEIVNKLKILFAFRVISIEIFEKIC